MDGEASNEPDNTDMIDMFNGMVDEMFEYGRDILNAKRNNPSDDLLSAIANAELEGQKLSPEFLDGSWLLIIFAGNDTTRNTLSGAIKLLTENPDQKQKLIENPELMPNFLQECIRMVSPVIHMRRTTTCGTELGGQLMGPGEKIVMWYGAANRDPSVFSVTGIFAIIKSLPTSITSMSRYLSIFTDESLKFSIDIGWNQILLVMIYLN